MRADEKDWLWESNAPAPAGRQAARSGLNKSRVTLMKTPTPVIDSGIARPTGLLRRTAAFLLLACVGLTPGAPADAQAKSFSVAPHGELRLALPAGWKDVVKPSPRDGSPTIQLSSATGESFAVLVSPTHPSSTQPVWAKLKTATEDLARPSVAQSVEQKADVKSFKGEETDGYYYSLTDSAPSPGEYKYMSQGLERVGDLLLQFTILSNDPTQKIRDTALEMLRTAHHQRPAQASLGIREIPVSGQNWKVRILDPGLGPLQQESDAGQFTCRSSSAAGFNLSLFVERPANTGTRHGDVFEHYWPQSRQNPLIDQDSIKIERNPKFVKVSYRIGPMPNVNYYFAYKGRWADLHISKLPFAKEDEKLLASFEQSLSYGE